MLEALKSFWFHTWLSRGEVALGCSHEIWVQISAVQDSLSEVGEKMDLNLYCVHLLQYHSNIWNENKSSKYILGQYDYSIDDAKQLENVVVTPGFTGFLSFN